MSSEIIEARKKLLRAMDKVCHSNKVPNFFSEIYYNISRDEKKYLSQSLDDPKKVSYAPKPSYAFNSNSRVKTTLGKYINKNYKRYFNFSDAELDKFVSKVISNLFNTQEVFSMLCGKDIEKAFIEEVGGHTCMTGIDRAPFIQLYVENPKHISLLVLNKVEARALLWITKQDKILIDRIYPNQGQHISLFEKHAEENGWIMREHQGAPDEDRQFSDKYSVVLKQPTNDQYPFMDSLKYAKKLPDEKLFLTNDSNYDHETVLDNASGRYFDDRKRCNKCGTRTRYYFEKNEEYYCEECAFTCRCCNSVLVYSDDLYKETIEGYVCDDCYINKMIECSCCTNKILPQNKHEVEGDFLCPSCFSMKYVYCTNCNDAILIKDKISNGWHYFCKKCYDKRNEENA